MTPVTLAAIMGSFPVLYAILSLAMAAQPHLATPPALWRIASRLDGAVTLRQRNAGEREIAIRKGGVTL